MMSLFARCSQGLLLRLSAFLCSAGAKWASPSTLTDRARGYAVATTLVMQITEGLLMRSLTTTFPPLPTGSPRTDARVVAN
jgi:hypothetical protein